MMFFDKKEKKLKVNYNGCIWIDMNTPLPCEACRCYGRGTLLDFIENDLESYLRGGGTRNICMPLNKYNKKMGESSECKYYLVPQIWGLTSLKIEATVLCNFSKHLRIFCTKKRATFS